MEKCSIVVSADFLPSNVIFNLEFSSEIKTSLTHFRTQAAACLFLTASIIELAKMQERQEVKTTQSWNS